MEFVILYEIFELDNDFWEVYGFYDDEGAADKHLKYLQRDGVEHRFYRLVPSHFDVGNTMPTEQPDLRDLACASAHVIIEAGIVPGVSYPCRCDECCMVARRMDDAGYLDDVPEPDRWWKTPEKGASDDRKDLQ